MKITLNKEFNTRQELDSFVLSRLGDNQKENIEHEIELTEDEGQNLGLGENNKVYGVRIKILKAKK